MASAVNRPRANDSVRIPWSLLSQSWLTSFSFESTAQRLFLGNPSFIRLLSLGILYPDLPKGKRNPQHAMIPIPLSILSPEYAL